MSTAFQRGSSANIYVFINQTTVVDNFHYYKLLTSNEKGGNRILGASHIINIYYTVYPYLTLSQTKKVN